MLFNQLGEVFEVLDQIRNPVALTNATEHRERTRIIAQAPITSGEQLTAQLPTALFAIPAKQAATQGRPKQPARPVSL